MNTLHITIAILVLIAGWFAYNYWRLRRAATVLDNAAFAEKIFTGQLIDLRDPNEYRRKHIMGARNIPYEQLKQSLGAIRKGKAVLLYENDRGQRVTSAALYLKKQGYKEIYILSYGLNAWDGKVKTN